MFLLTVYNPILQRIVRTMSFQGNIGKIKCKVYARYTASKCMLIIIIGMFLPCTLSNSMIVVYIDYLVNPFNCNNNLSKLQSIIVQLCLPI